jgi:hypothetical protein
MTTPRQEASSTPRSDGRHWVAAAAAMSQPPPPAASGPLMPRRFLLDRLVDVSGVSGTGVVAEGVRWSDGTAALRWHGGWQTVSIWDSVDAVLAVHGNEGATVLRWLDPDRVVGDTLPSYTAEGTEVDDSSGLVRAAALPCLDPSRSDHGADPH